MKTLNFNFVVVLNILSNVYVAFTKLLIGLGLGMICLSFVIGWVLDFMSIDSLMGMSEIHFVASMFSLGSVICGSGILLLVIPMLFDASEDLMQKIPGVMMVCLVIAASLFFLQEFFYYAYRYPRIL